MSSNQSLCLAYLESDVFQLDEGNPANTTDGDTVAQKTVSMFGHFAMIV